MSDLRSRLRGSLYGLAVGDALGAPYEFKGRRAYKVSGNMEDSYIFKHDGKPLKAGTWTDDTRCIELLFMNKIDTKYQLQLDIVSRRIFV